MRRAPYVRPAGRAILYPQAALNWFGPGSRSPVEFHHVATQTDTWASSYGAVDARTGIALPDVMVSRDRYVALRPRAVARDMVLADWTAGTLHTDSGEWEVNRPAFPGAKLHLNQIDSTAGVTFNRKSSWEHGKDASFAARLQVMDPAPDTDPTTGAPYFAVSWGDNAWALFFVHNQPPILAQRKAGAWQARAQLPQPPRPASQPGSGDVIAFVELKRDALFVRFEFHEDSPPPIATDPALPVVVPVARKALEEAQHEGYYAPAGGVTWPSGRFEVFGSGVAASVEIDTVAYPSTGTYTSHQIPLKQPRGTAIGGDQPELDLWAFDAAGAGDIDVVILNDHLDSFFQYRATLESASQAISGRTWMRTPDFQALSVFYPAVTTPGFLSPGDFGQELNGRIESFELSKPESLSEAQFRASCYFPDGFNSKTGNWRFRPIRVMLGWDRESGYEEVPVFAGYLVGMRAKQEEDTTVSVDMVAQSGSLRGKRMRFGHTTAPRGQRTLNEILDLWLGQMGVPLSDRIWDLRGSLITLERGTAENPAFLPRPDSDAFDWHAKLCDYHGLQLVWTDLGQYRTIGKHEVIPSGLTWRAQATTDTAEGIESLSVEEDVLGVFTRLVVLTETAHGGQIFRWGINLRAEQDPNWVEGFRPWPEEHVERLDFGPMGVGLLNLAAWNLGLDYLVPRYRVRWSGEFEPALSRRHAVTILGDRMQVAGIYVVESVEHQVDDMAEMRGKTNVSAYRLTP